MSIHPVLLSAMLADLVVLGRKEVLTLHELGVGNLVGELPQEVALPMTSTRMGLQVPPQSLMAAGLSLNMVCWPLRKKLLSWGATRLEAGREAANDLMLLHPSVGRHHLRLLVEGNGVSAVELGSVNGTTVDDVPLVPNQPLLLHDGARLKVGAMPLTYFTTEKLLDVLSGT